MDVKTLHAKIGELTLKTIFRTRAHQGGIAERKAMIDREHKLPISQQAKVLGISRGTAYYQPKPVSPRVLALMNRIDRLHLSYPSPAPECCAICCAGEGYQVGRKHVATLMKRMGIEALYRKPRTTKRHPGHKVYPYLLRNLPVTRANQGLGDGYYLPSMARGFVTWLPLWTGFTRRVLSGRSLPPDVHFCLRRWRRLWRTTAPGRHEH